MVRKSSQYFSSAFTLIELLVVIAIIAILAVVVVLTLNPAQMLAQGRDSNRVSDMSTLNSAINLYNTDQSGTSSYSLGTSSVVYVSIPDPTATTTSGSNCSSLSLPTLPSGYTYHCAGPSYYRNINGTGWIPINLQNISAGTPLGNLPVDPVNTSSSRLYYTYITNGSQFETTAPMESSKYQTGGSNDVISPDGGILASVYEKGSKLGLEPLDYGDNSLVGYWPFSEGSGSTSGVTQAYDWSGNGNNGTWYGTATGTSGYYSPGKVGSWAGAFDGGTDYVNTNLDMGGKSTMTVTAWINLSTTIIAGMMVADQWGGSPQAWLLTVGGGYCAFINAFSCSLSSNTWYFLVGVYDGTNSRVYLNGSLIGSTSATGIIATGASLTTIGARASDKGTKFSGLIDDVRIYNRALSAAQIAAMYNGGK